MTLRTLTLRTLTLGKPRWPMLHAVQSRAQLLDDMLCATRINARIAVGVRRGDAFIEARATCISCASSRACRRWLDAHSRTADAPDEVEPPEFCPNSQFIRICRSVVPSRAQVRNG